MSSLEQQIFQKGSTTYYFSSQFFPRGIREDVFRLYSFVRVIDDLVDKTPPDTKLYQQIKQAWEMSSDPDQFASPHSNILKNIRMVTDKYGFDRQWISAFFDSMQADLDKKNYQTIDDSLWYMYGSAEVVGLMMAKIMGLSSTALLAARLQGRSMQFINFLRDIDEDNSLGRCYFPTEDLIKFGLPNLNKETAVANPQVFKDFMRYQLDRYVAWQYEADEGFKYIPRRLRIPLQTAVDMYNWTGQVIALDPMVVFERKVKPRKRRVILSGARNGLIILPGYS